MLNYDHLYFHFSHKMSLKSVLLSINQSQNMSIILNLVPSNFDVLPPIRLGSNVLKFQFIVVESMADYLFVQVDIVTWFINLHRINKVFINNMCEEYINLITICTLHMPAKLASNLFGKMTSTNALVFVME